MSGGLKIIIGIYFIIELLINYSLYKQMSVNSNVYAIESLEMWAKIVIGFGASLFYVQISSMYYKRKNEETDNETSMFILICLFTIPLSFLLQNYIVNTIVDRADQETINNSIIVAATKSTAVPYYDYSRATYNTDKVASGELWKVSYPFEIKENNVPWVYLQQERAFFDLASDCAYTPQQVLNLDKSVDRVFFAFNGVRSPSSINESMYKGLIKDFYICLYSDEKFKHKHIKGIEKTNVVVEQFEIYQEKSLEYRDFKWKAEERQHRNFKDKMMKELNKEWRKQMNEEMGFQTKIEVGLDFYDFVRHPDVKRAFLNKAEEGTIWPYGNEYAEFVTETIMNSLPDKIILGYQNQDGSIIEPAEGEMVVNGKEAYKSIIMPVVGISLSALFLIFNTITLSAAMISRLSIIAARVFVVLTLAWALLWPSHHLSKTAEFNPIVQDSGTLFKIIYYHEQNLGKHYSNFLGVD